MAKRRLPTLVLPFSIFLMYYACTEWINKIKRFILIDKALKWKIIHVKYHIIIPQQSPLFYNIHGCLLFAGDIRIHISGHSLHRVKHSVDPEVVKRWAASHKCCSRLQSCSFKIHIMWRSSGFSVMFWEIRHSLLCSEMRFIHLSCLYSKLWSLDQRPLGSV